MSTLDKNLLLEMFRKMEEIRRMDLKIAQLVKKGKVPGMTLKSLENTLEPVKEKVVLCTSPT